MTGNYSHQLPDSAPRNIAALFELLAQGWKAISDFGRPPWNQQALENNLLIFERVSPS